ncbi:hypothetical protein [Nodosilinea nodulosa]|uniref:hypothetical protein n=1 Tax=Nodosilinea nodulosa TaxID=416001 RepID=UPI0002E34E28|nr:hypothetical protein [Nodosilinea nodulosa]
MMPAMCQTPLPLPSQKTAAPPRAPGPRWLGLLGGLAIVVIGLLGGGAPALAQLSPSAPVQTLVTVDQPAATTSYPNAPFAPGCDTVSFPGCAGVGATINQTFGAGVNRVLLAVETAAGRFEPATDLLPPVGLPQQIVFRRDPGLLVARQSLFYEASVADATTLTLGPSESPSIEAAMLSSTINRGIDNVFNNTEAGPGQQETRNNIKRIDYIISSPGVTVAAADQGNVGFLIMERGGNDAFGIAAITAVDGAGLPTAYGPLVQIPTNGWGTSNTGVDIGTAVTRQDAPPPPDPAFKASHVVNNLATQTVRGIFFPISSLLTAPASTQPVFGYSLFSAAVTPADTLTDFLGLPTADGQSTGGGLDLIAGGFGLIRRVGGFSLVKRVSNLIGPSPLPDFSQVIGSDSAVNLLRNNGLGQGLIAVTDPPVATGNGIEYSIYLANSSNSGVTDLLVCDQIPVGTTFDPNAYGAGQGIQAIASSSPAGPVVTYTNANDADPGRFFGPGEALPAICGASQNNGAVVVNVGNINANQVGLVRFRVTVN